MQSELFKVDSKIQDIIFKNFREIYVTNSPFFYEPIYMVKSCFSLEDILPSRPSCLFANHLEAALFFFFFVHLHSFFAGLA